VTKQFLPFQFLSFSGIALHDIRERLGPNEKKLIIALRDRGGRIEEVAAAAGMDQATAMRSSMVLAELGLAVIREKTVHTAELTEEGRGYAEAGLPERRVLRQIAREGEMGLASAAEACGLDEREKQVAAVWLRKRGWAEFLRMGEETRITITEEGRSFLSKELPEEKIMEEMMRGQVQCEEGDERIAVLRELERRGLVELREKTVREIRLTEDGLKLLQEGLELSEEITELTHEILVSGRWREAGLRRYDVSIPGAPCYPAKRHPQQEVIDELREILVGLGFMEIEGRSVESEFWNFDALFQAQDHPAREIHDSLSLSVPRRARLPRALLRRVAMAHERGVDGSTGWGYRFNPEISARAVLCSQTTAATIRYLAQHPDPPAKVFCIHRVYRHEKIDYKHLAEFYQAEGIVMDRGLSFRDMLGYLKLILEALGFERMRFRPGMFPFTEPSVEADVYHPEMKEWIEILGAGMFRPEVTRPLGVRHPVLAWGIGLTRLIAIRLGLDDIRKLFSGDLSWIRGEKGG
jgi:phenylalanyl-tRNA synthetase alpha chain